MTTKQNAIDLANTARSEAANTAKRTIAAIITNWNECVKQAGFTGVFDFPTTGYTRKSQLIADLERCAAQLDDYVEPHPELATMTVEQQTREFNAALTRVLDADEAHEEVVAIDRQMHQDDFYSATPMMQAVWIKLNHAEVLEMDKDYQLAVATIADNLTLPVWEGCSDTVKRAVVKHHHAEALEINNAYNTLYVYAPGDAAREVWPQLTPVERAVSVEFAHKQALHENQQHDDAIAYFAAQGSRICLEAFTAYQIKQIADFCHSDALELNSAYKECA